MPSPSGTPILLGEGDTQGIRILRYTTKALVVLEELNGWTFAQLAVKAQAGSLKALVSLVWAGLLHEKEPPTMAQVADLIPLERVLDITEKAATAIQAAFGDKVEESAEGKAPAVS